MISSQIRKVAPILVVPAHKHALSAWLKWSDALLLTGGFDGCLRLWRIDLSVPAIRLAFEIKTPHLLVQVLFKTSRGQLVSGGEHGGLVIWEVAADPPGLSIMQELGKDTAYWHDNHQILEPVADTLISRADLPEPQPAIWKWRADKRTYVFSGNLEIPGSSLIIPGPGGSLFTGDPNGQLGALTWESQKESWHPTTAWQGHAGRVTGLDILSSGELISAGEDRCLRLWRPMPGGEPYQLGAEGRWPSTDFGLCLCQARSAIFTSTPPVHRLFFIQAKASETIHWKEENGHLVPSEILPGTLSGSRDRSILLTRRRTTDVYAHENGIFRLESQLTHRREHHPGEWIAFPPAHMLSASWGGASLALWRLE